MKNKKGISLIVLVITIIVMIILAAAIILSLNNAGIIGNANKAVEMTNDKTIQTAADLKYSEYILNNKLAGETPVGEWIETELIKDGVLTTEQASEYIITNEGQVIKGHYYDAATYRAYAEANGYIMLEDYERGIANSLVLEEEQFLSLSGKKVAIEYGTTSLRAACLSAIGPDMGNYGAIWGPINVTEVLIPNTVTSIDENAFNGYWSDWDEEEQLTIIRYNGTATQGAPWGSGTATLQKEI